MSNFNGAAHVLYSYLCVSLTRNGWVFGVDDAEMSITAMVHLQLNTNSATL